MLDKWIYTMKNMETMESIPFAPAVEIFDRLEKVASYAALSREEKRLYDAQLKKARDLQNQYDFAVQTGLAEGRAEEQRNSIRTLAEFGIPLDAIAEKYGITIDAVRQILTK